MCIVFYTYFNYLRIYRYQHFVTISLVCYWCILQCNFLIVYRTALQLRLWSTLKCLRSFPSLDDHWFSIIGTLLVLKAYVLQESQGLPFHSFSPLAVYIKLDDPIVTIVLLAGCRSEHVLLVYKALVQTFFCTALVDTSGNEMIPNSREQFQSVYTVLDKLSLMLWWNNGIFWREMWPGQTRVTV